MLLKSLLKPLRKQLLKFDCLRSLVARSLKRLEDESHAKHWATLMHSGRTAHVDNSDGPDNTMLVDYVDGRMVGQRHVTPNYIRPFGMGRWRL